MTGNGAFAGVIFDLDGTLVDSVPMSLSIINAMLGERCAGRRIPYEVALPFASLGGHALISGLLGEDSFDLESDLALFRDRYLRMPTPAESLYPGVAGLLTDLNEAGVRLAICSNKPQPLCEKVLRDLGIAHLFAAIVGSSPSLPAKPAPDMLDETFRRLGLRAGQCVMVGDSEVDIALARSRQLECFFVTYGYGNPDSEVQAHHRFDDVETLYSALLPGRAAQQIAEGNADF